ncbi:hypothetical protein FNV43_RR08082 [Rhamnella rubrinervis]|uniref:Dormancy-associated protein homolog 4 n=1 Tax=Rhamnella rubrinervis TaxID=2594499 RepID=A0A8K0MMR5_9ROSA|nr:hypothetical protein FNV43_RR08082 [Rhamnella rubrinervis]
MEFLHKLWDETLAGPAPDAGLGKLRKYDSFSATRSRSMVLDHDVPVTRSITLLRTKSTTASNLSVDVPGSSPESPAGPGTPGTPLTPGTPEGFYKKFTRRKSSAVALERAEPTSLTVCDWLF